jgi:hypothetical protein
LVVLVPRPVPVLMPHILLTFSMQEFEEIIDHEGAERVTSLMQKVITALEHLEVLVQKNDTELLLIEDLRCVE